MARKDFAERFQDTYCQDCGTRLLSRDETRVLHDPRRCRDKEPYVHYDTENGGRWVNEGYGNCSFYPRLLTRFCRCGYEVGLCHCTREQARLSDARWRDEEAKIAAGLLVRIPPKYGPCICDRERRAVLNCQCEKWAAKRNKAIERLNRSIERREERERKLKEPIRKLIRWALSE